MAQVTVGTFNVENLFLRYRLLDRMRGVRYPKAITREDFDKAGSILMLGVSIEEFGPVGKASRELTRRVIAENDADVLAVQEVENFEALKLFNRHYLERRYPYHLVIDGNDPRQIDVGLYSKLEILDVRTHQFDPPGSSITRRTFSRDCLEVELAVTKRKRLTVLVNHFKSQLASDEAEARRGRERRKRQATRVAEILKERFGARLEGNFVVCGDLNAAADASELQPLLGLPGVANVVERLPEDERWTHYYKRGKKAEQLDYLVLSPGLARTNPDTLPWIDRKGLGTDIDIYTGERYSDLSGSEGASDHCPVFVRLTV